MSGELVHLPRRGADIMLTKKQLARELHRSERWIEIKVREGMPVEEATDRYGRRRYNLRLVQEWLTNGTPAKPMDRVAVLERQVADLAAQVEQLRRAG
jgi:hypothetical protein